MVSYSAPAWFQEPHRARVAVDHLSAGRTSDGSMTIYCIVKNVDSIPATAIDVRIQVMDSVGGFLQGKEMVLLAEDTLMPGDKALFTELFEECWVCKEVEVSVR